jgi:SAM-dependent methyltransferase/2-polyprenyl-3-methyl-5-hydroxy-6-metoxy-1,4-benzoquinol methylase
VSRGLITNLLRRGRGIVGVPSTRQGLISDEVLESVRDKVAGRTPPPLSYGLVSDYCESRDWFGDLARYNLDLKDQQRCWMIKTLLAIARPGLRLLEIGGGEPLVAHILQRAGCEVTVVDPYEGAGNGPTEYERFKQVYPGVKLERALFDEAYAAAHSERYDVFYSISVLEHIPVPALATVFEAARQMAAPGARNIHCVDHVLMGRGADYHHSMLEEVGRHHGVSARQVAEATTAAAGDVETYFLSAEGHHRWRGGRPYEKFPMRRCISMQFSAPLATATATDHAEAPGSQMENAYFDAGRIETEVAAGRHREVIGGKWDQIGALQFEFLKAQGLRPHHKLLDVGCGSLRGGVHFVRYLDPAGYFGLDINPSLLDAGYDVELGALGLQDRLPRANLVCDAEFEAGGPDGVFDYAIAQSVFTHLSLNRIRQCLAKVARVMRPGGVFYATFFELPEDAPPDRPFVHQPGGKVTSAVEDPFHYRISDFRHVAKGLGWAVEPIGDWGHPRNQRMLAFRRLAAPAAAAPTADDKRALTVDQAAALQAGENHYRAYVGPPNRFDFMSATQFSLLFANGLRDHHRVLDFGAGSLRLGRLLIPYLRPNRYYAVEPNRWLVEDAIEHELGRDAIELKQPTFSEQDDFSCTGLGATFDFIMAQSIVTHCGPDLFQTLMTSFASVLEDDGLVLFSYWNTPVELPQPPRNGWIYPGSVKYTEDQLEAFLKQAGLHGAPIPWYHPGASWYLAAKSAERLPSEAERRLLSGAVLFDPQFAKSIPPAG